MLTSAFLLGMRDLSKTKTTNTVFNALAAMIFEDPRGWSVYLD